MGIGHFSVGDNANQAAPASPFVARISLATIDGHIELRVHDDGPGPLQSGAAADHWFLPFTSTRENATPADSGLAIVESIAVAAGGGMTKPTDGAAATRLCASTYREPSEPTAAPRIAVLDPVEELRDITCMMLEQAGFETAQYRSLAELSDMTNAPDLIVVAQTLPDGDAQEAINRIRQTHGEFPAIIMDTTPQPVDLPLCHVLQKPFTLDQLLTGVRAWEACEREPTAPCVSLIDHIAGQDKALSAYLHNHSTAGWDNISSATATADQWRGIHCHARRFAVLLRLRILKTTGFKSHIDMLCSSVPRVHRVGQAQANMFYPNCWVRSATNCSHLCNNTTALLEHASPLQLTIGEYRLSEIWSR